TLYTAPSGAQVFAAGSIGFSRTLAGAGRWDPAIQQLVANLFSKFAGDGTLPAQVRALAIPSGAPVPLYRAGVQVSTVTRSLVQPMGIALEANGNLLVADSWNLRIREVTPQGAVTTWVGCGAVGVDNGAGRSATLQFPMAIAVTPAGDALFAEPDVGWLRKVTG